MPSSPCARMPRFHTGPPVDSGYASVNGSRTSDISSSSFFRLIPWVLAAESLALPFFFFGSLGDPFQLPKDLLFRWGALLILGLWLAGTLSAGRVTLRRSGVTAPLLLLMFIGLLSVFQASNPAEASTAVRDMAFCAVVLMVSLVCVEKGSHIVAASLGAGAAATATLGILQIFLGPRLSFLPPTQGGALVGDVSTGALFVAITLPLLVTGTMSPGKGWLWTPAAGVSLAYVLVARSRAAWLGAATGMAVLLLVMPLRRKSPAHERAAAFPAGAAFLAAILLAAALVLGGAYGRGLNIIISAPPSMKTVELQGTELRMETWQATLRMILAHPLGVGAGCWRRAFPREAGNLAPHYPFASSRLPQSAGNEYLETAAELGLGGLLLFLWILARVLITGWRKSASGQGLPASALASLASAAACGLLASPLREQPGLWTVTVLAALVLSPGREHESRSREEISWEMAPGRGRVVGILATICFLLLLAIAGWGTLRVWTAGSALQVGQGAYLRGEYAAAIPPLRRSSELDPSSSLARYFTGASALAAGQLDLAQSELRAAQRLNPQDAATLLTLASSLRAMGAHSDAIAVGEKAGKIWPQDETVQLALGDLKRAAGDLDGALNAYRAALKGNASSVKAYLKMGELMESRSQKSGAVAAFSKAASLDPYLPEALEHLGGGYMKQGDYESAVQVFSNLLSFQPDDMPALIGLTRTLAGMARPCEALTYLDRARGLERNPLRQTQLDQARADLAVKCGKERPPAR
jgi:tetratricopeptide (TPR) repeat protein/O-antigen ligase